ncbi:hypothetical protein [Microcoleus sp. D2_18a_B4]|uniref:hypothetical protein n=1 Tax=Microcoleus sp. D2_18a_B4 TaxID=3055329 RepID=UPI002FD09416
MKRVRWLSGLLSAGVLSFSLATVGAQVAQAQRPIFLLELNCVHRGFPNYQEQARDVSIGREIYTSRLLIWASNGAGWTCQLPGGPASLRIEYGVADGDGLPPAKIDVYVDGNQVASQVGKDGRVNTMLVDVSNGKSVAVDIYCSRATNCSNKWYYFFWLAIIPGAGSPGSR